MRHPDAIDAAEQRSGFVRRTRLLARNQDTATGVRVDRAKEYDKGMFS